MMPKVLISDKLSPRAKEIFEVHGVDVDVRTDLSLDELKEILPDYDGIAIRSATKLKEDVLQSDGNLKVVGRAGIGVDNVDVDTATARGIIVMNTPYGNAITTAEHAIAMMFALARQIPEASASTKAGKWEKSKFMGVELTNKTLGIIGCGNIGAIVASRALGLKMRVVAFDPFLTQERATELGVEKVELETLLTRADFITIHTPLNDKTRGLLNEETFAMMKKGARLIHCARGGIVDEKALYKALKDGHLAGAALDVFEVEPATDNPLFELENVICTPHLGAATAEAQENVAIQIAEQMSDYLNNGAITNALNAPSLSAEDAIKLKPYLGLSEQLGRFLGQIASTGIKQVKITYEGILNGLNVKPLTALILTEVLKPSLDHVNLVNAPVLAKQRNIKVTEATSDMAGDYSTRLRVELQTDKQTIKLSGTLFGNKQARLLTINDVEIEAELSGHMLYVHNNDKPGFIGALGTVLGRDGINIAHFHLGRSKQDDTAVALVKIDQAAGEETLAAIQGLDQCLDVKALSF